MFNSSGNIYTIHENLNLPDAADRIELVREGFAFWAFSLSVVWLLAQRLWLPALAYMVVIAVVGKLMEILEVSSPSIVIVELGMQCLLGFHANDIKRWALARRGYRMRGVVCAESQLTAQQRVFATTS